MIRKERSLEGVPNVTRFIPQVRRLLKAMDREVAKKGPGAGFSYLFSERNARIKSRWDSDEDKTKQILADPSKPVILVSNHPHQLEPLIFLAELPQRKNTSVIGMSELKKILGPQMQKQYIPVYRNPPLEPEEHKAKRRAKNIESINEATRRLRDNEAVLIAPAGGERTGKWQRGVSLLVEEALQLDEAYIVMGYVPNSKAREIGRLFMKKWPLKRTVYISDAINVHDLPIPQVVKAMPYRDKEKMAEFSKALQENYEAWVAPKVKPQKAKRLPKII